MHGARVIALRGNFDEALTLVRELVQRHPIALVNSVNPFRLEGQKTAAFEVLDALGELDALCIPVGNAGNVTAYWKGFKEMGASPRLFGFQAEGAAPLVHRQAGRRTRRRSRARSGSATRRAGRRRWRPSPSSRGSVAAVSDAPDPRRLPLPRRQRGRLLRAGLAPRRSPGLLAHGVDGAERVVCVLTGHGLKDPQTALAHAGAVVPCEPDIAAVERGRPGVNRRRIGARPRVLGQPRPGVRRDGRGARPAHGGRGRRDRALRRPHRPARSPATAAT